jgi:hypothetical protein
MTEYRLFAGWLRLVTGIAAAAGVLALSACGGGSGAPNNFFKSTMTVLPVAGVAYSGVPTTLTISGGTGPFRATSSNSGVLPVLQNVQGRTVLLLASNVVDDTEVTVTVQDLGPLQPVAPSMTSTITVRAAPLLNSLTITPNLDDCGTGLCSGQNGTASVTVLGPQGGALAGHAVRFDVVGSSYAIVSNNPGQPLVSSLTVLSDSTGKATVLVKANVNAPTQFVQMSVTDLTSGQQLIGNFTIVQVTDGSAILTVVPSEAEIKGAFKGVCSNGFATDYYIYGGTPPYRVTSTFPNSVTLTGSPVNTNGGFFRATTNGSCVDPLKFSILDAMAPTETTSAMCTGNSFNFVVYGGTPPYNVNPTAGIATPQLVNANGGSTMISGLMDMSGDTSIVFLDSSTPAKSVVAKITCA